MRCSASAISTKVGLIEVCSIRVPQCSQVVTHHPAGSISSSSPGSSGSTAGRPRC
jgi:hypothetical protein